MRTVCKNPTGAPCVKACGRRVEPEAGDEVIAFDNWNNECKPLRPDTWEEIEEQRINDLKEFRKDLNR